MAWVGGGINPQWTVRQLSHAVEEIVQRLTILCLGLIDSGTDRAGIGRLRGGCLARGLALGEDLLHVGVVFVHAVSLQGQGAESGAEWTVAQPSAAAA